MWLYIIGGMLLAMAAGVLYLISRLCKTELLRTLTGKKRLVRMLVATSVMAVAIFLLWRTIDLLNTVIVLVHAFIIWGVFDVAALVVRKIRKKPLPYNTVATAVLVFFAVYFPVAWYRAHHVVATRYQLTSKKEVAPLRVAQITDSHLGATFDGEGFAQELQKIQTEEPDLLVITGDYVDDDTIREDMITACEALGKFQSTYGVYYVFGNHDKGYYSDERRGFGAQDLVDCLEENHVTVLQDETVAIGEDYLLIGRQDKSQELYVGGRASMEELTQDLDPEKYWIFLDHQPNDYAAQAAVKADLVLSGHTHGGQFWPILRLGELAGLNDMTYGLRKTEDTVFETSSGISDWAIKFKTGCKAEYVILDIQ